jgi:hypothetical protein
MPILCKATKGLSERDHAFVIVYHLEQYEILQERAIVTITGMTTSTEEDYEAVSWENMLQILPRSSEIKFSFPKGRWTWHSEFPLPGGHWEPEEDLSTVQASR